MRVPVPQFQISEAAIKVTDFGAQTALGPDTISAIY